MEPSKKPAPDSVFEVLSSHQIGEVGSEGRYDVFVALRTDDAWIDAAPLTLRAEAALAGIRIVSFILNARHDQGRPTATIVLETSMPERDLVSWIENRYGVARYLAGRFDRSTTKSELGAFLARMRETQAHRSTRDELFRRQRCFLRQLDALFQTRHAPLEYKERATFKRLHLLILEKLVAIETDCDAEENDRDGNQEIPDDDGLDCG